MSKKLTIKLNGAIVMQHDEEGQSLLYKYCEKHAPKGEWRDITKAELNSALEQAQADLEIYEKSKKRWEHILQISKFNPQETAEAYGHIEDYDEHITEIIRSLHRIGGLMDIIDLNEANNIDYKIEWTIEE